MIKKALLKFRFELFFFIITILGTLCLNRFDLFVDYTYYVNYIFIIFLFTSLVISKRESARKIDQLLTIVEKFKNNLSGTVEQIYGSCSQINETTGSQASAITQTSSSCYEVNTLTSTNSENFKYINDSLEDITKIIERSSKDSLRMERVLEKGNDNNEEVMTMINSTKDMLEDLTSLFSQVVSKTNIINDIVFQTKLLSFNASVEAARAGVHGKGFSVVAEEIGKLARMSGESASSIQGTLGITEDKVRNIIDEISSKSSYLEKIINDQTRDGQSTISDFKESFSRVSSGAEVITSLISTAALAAAEQAQAMAEINDATLSVNESIQQNSLVVGQTTNLAKELAKEIDKFNESLFNLSRTHYVEIDTSLDEIPWSKEYEINIEKIDTEHKNILNRINILIQAMNSNHTEKTKEAFTELKSYTLLHFKHEEDFMLSFSYDSYESHKRVHDNLIQTVLRYGEDIDNGNLEKSKLASFLRNWLFTHIVGVDTKYAEVYFEKSSSRKSA
ncbi:hypothetical protein A9Q84_16380 [Halobacteriovorax marinus]|uniref:Methyl-accepting transducer domain-containing protein n=1 Tax=Halobacteriovorax marinus TaxID=97084 RepID=A0A1Y5FA40_9BACT|nr:hypothetical protein A9Q84_16380 [Halobacteriovorax marinus]